MAPGCPTPREGSGPPPHSMQPPARLAVRRLRSVDTGPSRTGLRPQAGAARPAASWPCAPQGGLLSVPHPDLGAPQLTHVSPSPSSLPTHAFGWADLRGLQGPPPPGALWVSSGTGRGLWGHVGDTGMHVDQEIGPQPPVDALSPLDGHNPEQDPRAGCQRHPTHVVVAPGVSATIPAPLPPICPLCDRRLRPHLCGIALGLWCPVPPLLYVCTKDVILPGLWTVLKIKCKPV